MAVNAVVADLRGVYAAVFSEPPYHEGPAMADRFAGWLADESRLPGFRLVASYDGGQLVGFAYGYTKAPGDWWRHADRPPVETIGAAEKFAVMEWAVLPSRRGKGIGRRLLEALLAGRPEPYATLAVNPASDARIIYERWGWRQVGSTRAGRSPAMDIMTRELPW
jgi:ribosomal protein S18 acetylase RimI-like enzyme